MTKGRPTKIEQAKRERAHREEFDIRFGKVEECVRGLRHSNSRPEVLIAEFKKELGALADGLEPARLTHGSTAPTALKSEAVSRYLLQSRRLAALRTMSSLVAAETDNATIEVEHWRFEILRLLLDQEPIDQYQRELAAKLDESGLTRPVMQALHHDQIVDFVSHINAAAHARRENVPLPLNANNAAKRQEWRRVLTDPSLISATRVDREPDDPELVELTACGLPPFAAIEDYAGASMLIDQFHSGSPQTKIQNAREIIATWAQKQAYRSRPTARQKRVWLCLLGVKYGFAHEILGAKQFNVPSPWAATEIIELKCN